MASFTQSTRKDIDWRVTIFFYLWTYTIERAYFQFGPHDFSKILLRHAKKSTGDHRSEDFLGLGSTVPSRLRNGWRRPTERTTTTTTTTLASHSLPLLAGGSRFGVVFFLFLYFLMDLLATIASQTMTTATTNAKAANGRRRTERANSKSQPVYSGMLCLVVFVQDCSTLRERPTGSTLAATSWCSYSSVDLCLESG